jgi:hypothetical protein
VILKDKRTIVRAFAKQYQNGRKRDKSLLLTKIAKTTGYHRKYLGRILNNPPAKRRIRRVRISPYICVLKPLKKLWAVGNYACGERLVPMIPVYLSALKRHEKWYLQEKEKKLLLAISSSTVNRLLRNDRRRINLTNRSRTKPGTLLKNQIPIRTFSDWHDEEKKPGFLEIDTVHHCTEDNKGDYIHTLDTTDVFTGWNECRAFMGKSERHTVEGLETIRKRLPFPLLGIDFDTGGEFVNYHLVRYAERNRITYTRAREEKKNDQNYIEQQNFSVVRRFVGYGRLDTYRQLTLLNRLYDLLSHYQNFFQPVMRLKEKVRNGTRITRRYDRPKTAYQRVLEYSGTKPEVKEMLRKRFLKLNPRRLLLHISLLGRKLTKK